MKKSYNSYDLNKYKVSSDKIPQGDHWAIIKFETISIDHEGDERSRTHPGHGYPAYTEHLSTSTYFAFNSSEQWEKFVKDIVLSEEKGFLFIAAKTVVPTVTVSVQI